MKTTKQTENQPIKENWQIELTARLAQFGRVQTEIVRTGLSRADAIAMIDAEEYKWTDETESAENYAASWDNEDIMIERTYSTQLVIHTNWKMVIINAINLAEQPWKKGTPTHYELAEHYSTRLF